MMKPLVSASALRNAIRKVLQNPKEDRIIAVGFVGANPLEWLPSPEGIELYCWPRAGATHPDGIDKLLAANVNVHFVDRLHTKIYWGRNTGTVIGSANLSHSALHDGGLIEAGVLLGPGDRAIRQFLLSLKGSAIGEDDSRFSKVLEKLREDDIQLRQRNPESRGPIVRTRRDRTFAEWMAMPHRQEWQLGHWATSGGKPPRDAVAQFKQSHPGKSHANWRSGDSKNELKPFVPTIDCKTRASRWGIALSPAPFWWYPEPVVVSYEKSWSSNKYQWAAQIRVPSGRQVPFDIRDKRFLKALDKAVEVCGDKVDKFRGPVKDDFVELLAHHYGSK
jgi:hypothetical protein